MWLESLRGKDGAAGGEGKDGRDGREGKDGAPGRDALDLTTLPEIDPAKGYPRGTFAEHRGGTIRAIRNTDPIITSLELAGWVVAMNGIHAEQEEVSDEGRSVTRKTTYTNGREYVREIKTAVMLYRGVWREGEFLRGDVATWGGSAWHCQNKTTDKPGGDSPGWKMMVKEGARGRDAKAPIAPAVESVVKLR